jgi:hypothetical protein
MEKHENFWHIKYIHIISRGFAKKQNKALDFTNSFFYLLEIPFL